MAACKLINTRSAALQWPRMTARSYIGAQPGHKKKRTQKDVGGWRAQQLSCLVLEGPPQTAS